ncbi:MAG: hypothetical protein PHI89_00950 [Thiovulaceae bacterium]|jgi:hypothetical protein|nr:hypothetical protein [Sulfurimonadaceae bacterium]MDD3816637.1 hypothetical protein [Sulfurimonadaceae bacterium]
MWKISLVVCALVLGGCSYFTFNAPMCDQIASDPHATVPKECRNYNEEEAAKAFDNTKHKQNKDDIEQIIEFNKENK